MFSRMRDSALLRVLGTGLLVLVLQIPVGIQDYALLVGSAGLFVVLAAVMWLTRRIDWYSLGARSVEGALTPLAEPAPGRPG